MESKDNVTEVVYDKAKKYKRWFAFFIDVFVTLILGLFLSAALGAITKCIPAYQNVVAARDSIEESTPIYKDGKAIILVMDQSEDPVASKKNILNDAIEVFYKDSRFFNDEKYYSAYQLRKKSAKASDGGNLFVEDDAEQGRYLEGNYSDQDYYSFYYSEIEHYCIAYLSLNSDYVKYTSIIVRTSVIEFLLCLSVGYAFAFLIVPLIIRRGRRTIGMYLFRISLISVDALNVSGKTLLGRDLLLYFIGYWLSVFTFFLPWAVSVTMMHFSKRGQDFFDYVSNTYVIDSSKKDVYLNYAEYLSRAGLKETASLENKDFTLDS